MTSFRVALTSTSSVASILLLLCGSPHGDATAARHHSILSQDAPSWTRLTRVSLAQDGPFLSIMLEVADSIPRSVSDSCFFQFLINSGVKESSVVMLDGFAADHVVTFDLTHWDGSPWFAVNIYSRFADDGTPRDTVRMFDWKLRRNTLKVRFALHGLGWPSVKAKARVFYRSAFASSAPDSGFAFARVDDTPLQILKSGSGRRSRMVYPAGFDSLVTKYQVLAISDIAYDYERQLTGVLPVGGDSVRYVFNPFYGGAAIEGNPIYLGPGMWGDRPLWFVYFHEMGHNFVNASARFEQLYPLEMKLPPGPLPTNILFYEAWASLPAMYVFDVLDHHDSTDQTLNPGLRDVRTEWMSTRSRFEKAWNDYKGKPVYSSLDPDIVDGMFMELQRRFGWEMFRQFFALMRPATDRILLFDTHLDGDSRDLRSTRSTLTAAALSAAANTDLRSDFKKWNFPLDEDLFNKAFTELQALRQ